jgi:hypothetical protein
LAAARRSAGAQAGVCPVAGVVMQRPARAEKAAPASDVQGCSTGVSSLLFVTVIGRISDYEASGEPG